MQHETRKNVFTAILINARSLKDKLESLKSTLCELGADVCMLTETWFKENSQINNLLDDFTNKSGYTFLRRDRTGLKRGGGVAICYDSNRIQLSRAKDPSL